MISFPPQNFRELQKCLVLMKQGEIALELNPKNLSALEEMVSQADFVAKNTISEVAERVSISPSTVTRLAKLLGYTGFNSFQNVFKQRLEIPCDFYSHKLNDLESLTACSAKTMLKRQTAHTANNIQSCLQNIDEQTLDSVTDMLSGAKRVFLFGHKQSSVLAGAMQYGLSLIRDNVQPLVQLEYGLAIAIGQLRSSDLVVLFGSSPYSEITTKIASLLKTAPCKTVVVTDSDLSPLIDESKLSVTIPTDGDYYTNSLAANMIFIESLLSSTALKNPIGSAEHLLNLESLLTGAASENI